MSISPADFLDTAKRLSASDAEADIRSAISRAYYAAFHAADRATPDSYSPTVRRDKSSHEIVIEAIARYGRSLEPGRTEASRIARVLPVLKRLRVHADYRLDMTNNHGEVTDAISKSEHVVDLARDLLRKRDPSLSL